ncbi:MAG: serine/threonine-protein kinase, partial [Polyangiales bacterium]
ERAAPTEKRLALKVILSSHLADPDARARFLREVRIAAAIDHPNVVRVFEPAMHGDTMLLPMELVEGVTLRAHLQGEDGRARRLPVAELVGLMAQICAGVATVHAGGVIHRDLKPANIMLVRAGREGAVAKVLDFGAARHLDGHDEHTRAGVALGTPPYMAPEQLAAARDLDARVDAYALGVIAYEALVGQRPHGAAGGAEVMAKVLTQAPFPRPRALRHDLPAALDAAVMEALAFSRDARTPSVLALRDALRAAAALSTAGSDAVSELRSAELVVERPTRVPPRATTPQPLRAAGALGVLAAALVVLAVVLRANRGPVRPSALAAAPTQTAPVARHPVVDAPVRQTLRIHDGPSAVVDRDAGPVVDGDAAADVRAPAAPTSARRSPRRLPRWAR